MPRIEKLTKKAVEELPFQGDQQVLYWVGELKGLGILVSGKKKVKSFVVQRAIKGLTKRRTLGTWTEYLAAGKTVEDIKTEAAKLIFVMREGRDPKVEAEAAETARVEKEAQVKAQSITLRQALETYLRDSQHNREAKTLNAYRNAIQNFFPYWLDTPLRKIKPSDLKEAHGRIREQVGKGETRNSYKSDIFSSEAGSASANHALRSLRAVWKYAYSDNREYVPDWPTESLKRIWARIPRRKRFIKADNLKTFVQAVNDFGTTNRNFRDYILLLLFTGFRREEAASLRWVQLDFKARIIRLSADDTKADRPLDLPMSNFVFELLSARKALGVEGEFVFPSHSASGHLEEPKKAFDMIAARCGIRMNPHALRSTFCTIGAQSGITGYELKALVNHSTGGNNDVTAGYIQELNLPRAVQAVANKIMEFCGIELAPNLKQLVKKIS